MQASKLTVSLSLTDTIEMTVADFLLACGTVNGKRISAAYPTSNRVRILIDEANVARDVWYLLDAIARGERQFKVETPAGEAVLVELDKEIEIVLTYNSPERYGGTGKGSNRYKFPEALARKAVKIYASEPLEDYTDDEMRDIMQEVYRRGEVHFRRINILEKLSGFPLVEGNNKGGFFAVDEEVFEVRKVRAYAQVNLKDLSERIAEEFPKRGLTEEDIKPLTREEKEQRKKAEKARREFSSEEIDAGIDKYSAVSAALSHQEKYIAFCNLVLAEALKGIALEEISNEQVSGVMDLAREIEPRLAELMADFLDMMTEEKIYRSRVEAATDRFSHISLDNKVYLEGLDAVIYKGRPFVDYKALPMLYTMNFDEDTLRDILEEDDYFRRVLGDHTPEVFVIARPQDGVLGYFNGQDMISSYLDDAEKEYEVGSHELGHFVSEGVGKLGDSEFSWDIQERVRKNVELYSHLFPLMFVKNPKKYVTEVLIPKIMEREKDDDAYALASAASLNAFCIEYAMERITDKLEENKINEAVKKIKSLSNKKIRELAIKFWKNPKQYFPVVYKGYYYKRVIMVKGGPDVGEQEFSLRKGPAFAPRVKVEEVGTEDLGEDGNSTEPPEAPESEKEGKEFVDDDETIEEIVSRKQELPLASRVWMKKYQELFAQDEDVDDLEVHYVSEGGTDINVEAWATKNADELLIAPEFEEEDKPLAQNVFFIVDGSGSIMSNVDLQQAIENMIYQYSSFLLELSRKNPDLNVAIGNITTKLKILFDFNEWKQAKSHAARRELIRDALSKIWQGLDGGGIDTPAMLDKLSTIEFPHNQAKDVKNLVVVFTDGEETGRCEGQSLQDEINAFRDGKYVNNQGKNQVKAVQNQQIDMAFFGVELQNDGEELVRNYPTYLNLGTESVEAYYEAFFKLGYCQAKGIPIEGNLDKTVSALGKDAASSQAIQKRSSFSSFVSKALAREVRETGAPGKNKRERIKQIVCTLDNYVTEEQEYDDAISELKYIIDLDPSLAIEAINELDASLEKTREEDISIFNAYVLQAYLEIVKDFLRDRAFYRSESYEKEKLHIVNRIIELFDHEPDWRSMYMFLECIKEIDYNIMPDRLVDIIFEITDIVNVEEDQGVAKILAVMSIRPELRSRILEKFEEFRDDDIWEYATDAIISQISKGSEFNIEFFKTLESLYHKLPLNDMARELREKIVETIAGLAKDYPEFTEEILQFLINYDIEAYSSYDGQRILGEFGSIPRIENPKAIEKLKKLIHSYEAEIWSVEMLEVFLHHSDLHPELFKFLLDLISEMTNGEDKNWEAKGRAEAFIDRHAEEYISKLKLIKNLNWANIIATTVGVNEDIDADLRAILSETEDENRTYEAIKAKLLTYLTVIEEKGVRLTDYEIDKHKLSAYVGIYLLPWDEFVTFMDKNYDEFHKNPSKFSQAPGEVDLSEGVDLGLEDSGEGSVAPEKETTSLEDELTKLEGIIEEYDNNDTSTLDKAIRRANEITKSNPELIRPSLLLALKEFMSGMGGDNIEYTRIFTLSVLERIFKEKPELAHLFLDIFVFEMSGDGELGINSFHYDFMDEQVQVDARLMTMKLYLAALISTILHSYIEIEYVDYIKVAGEELGAIGDKKLIYDLSKELGKAINVRVIKDPAKEQPKLVRLAGFLSDQLSESLDGSNAFIFNTFFVEIISHEDWAIILSTTERLDEYTPMYDIFLVEDQREQIRMAAEGKLRVYQTMKEDKGIELEDHRVDLAEIHSYVGVYKLPWNQFVAFMDENYDEFHQYPERFSQAPGQVDLSEGIDLGLDDETEAQEVREDKDDREEEQKLKALCRKSIEMIKVVGENIRKKVGVKGKKKTVPIDFEIDLSLITKKNINAYAEMWAYLILSCLKYKNVNFVFVEEKGSVKYEDFTGLLNEEIRKKAGLISIDYNVENIIKKRIGSARNITSQDRIRIPICSSKKLESMLKGKKKLAQNEYPIALQGANANSKGTALRNFDAAVAIGLCKAALAIAKMIDETEGKQELSKLKKKLIEKLRKIYMIFIEDEKFKMNEDTLSYMVSASSKTRLELAIFHAIRPVTRMPINLLGEKIGLVNLYLQFA